MELLRLINWIKIKITKIDIIPNYKFVISKNYVEIIKKTSNFKLFN